jgi:hypothetical protein
MSTSPPKRIGHQNYFPLLDQFISSYNECRIKHIANIIIITGCHGNISYELTKYFYTKLLMYFYFIWMFQKTKISLSTHCSYFTYLRTYIIWTMRLRNRSKTKKYNMYDLILIDGTYTYISSSSAICQKANICWLFKLGI